MAGENFYVRAFDNVFVVDPNKVVNGDGFAEDRNVAQEKLIMYANLECNVQARSRLLTGEDRNSLENISIGSVNFLRPGNQDYLTTNWTELQSNNDKVLNSELLGIKSISYKCGAGFTPTVNITLEDVKGRALFESGNDSIYSVFLNLPYPTFYLTLKGYYGKALRYTLMLQKFNASFEAQSGNFVVTLNFVGFKYNVLSDLQQSFLLGLPNMYSRQTNQNIQTEPVAQDQASVTQINGDNTTTNSIIEKKGYSKIKSVYDLYKRKKIVAQDFPTLTVDQLVSKLQNFEKNLLENAGQMSVEELTNAELFDGNLNEYYKQVYSAISPPSWKTQYLDDKNFFIKMEKGKPIKLYTYQKKYLDTFDFDTPINKLNGILTENNNQLAITPTFGERAEDKNSNNTIVVNIKQTSVIPDPFIIPGVGEIDVFATAKERFQKENPTNLEFQKIVSELDNLKNIKNSAEDARNKNNIEPAEIPIFFRFDGEGFFVEEINKLKKTLNSKSNSIQEDLTKKINDKLKSVENGIGFEPTIRNVLAVILASADAFLRLMDDVHVQAFDARDNEKKKRAVAQDIKDVPNSPVFPWPLYAKEIPVEGETKYELKYPGDPDYVSDTGASDYTVWPEVEFVEEFQKGFMERQQKQLNQTPSDNELSTIKRLLITGFDTPSNTPYSDLQMSNYLIEIYERLQTIAQYQGFQRGGSSKYGPLLNFLQNFEATNIKTSLGTDSKELINFLKENNFTPDNYRQYLEQTFPKSFASVSAGTIYTPYLREEINFSTKLITSELPPIAISISTEKNGNEVEKTMTKYLTETDKNEKTFTDTYPFAIPDWNKTNLNGGEQNFQLNKVLNTTKSLFYNVKLKKVVNFTGDYVLDGKGDNSLNRPFNFYINPGSTINYDSLETNMYSYVIDRSKDTAVKNSFFTEGKVQDPSSLGRTKTNTTSIINTPQFIRAIQNGVNNDRTQQPHPFTQASYLFLNSLPLANLKRQYLDGSGGKRDYIGPTFNKYGAYHSLPKLWICKVGSVWHRYKTYAETGVDFLNSTLGPFLRDENYDPINQDPRRVYTFTSSTSATSVNVILTDSITNFDSTVADIITVGFYPVLLNDFYYFFNGGNLYSGDTTIQSEIQSLIDSQNIIITQNSYSQISTEVGYDTANPNNFLNYSTVSLMFKDTNTIESLGNFYFGAPSFGSVYSQVKAECFNGLNLVAPVLNNESVYNGSVRLLWGGTHFGYFPTINSISNPDEYLSRTKTNDWPFNFILDSSGGNFTLDKIEDLFGSFTRQELDLFEEEFLQFSDADLDKDDDFNLQSILKKSLRVEKESFFDQEPNKMIQKFQTNQLSTFNSSINKYINQNIILQKGNPTDFNLRNFSFFSQKPLLDVSESVERYNTTTPNAVPTEGGDVTWDDLITNYPEAWTSLLLNVGFSTVTGMTYNGESSFITDFFPENDVAFTSKNIQDFSKLIKIYATQKYINSSYNNASLSAETNSYLTELKNFSDIIFQGMMSKVVNNLPTVKTESENIDDTNVEGVQSKLEYYGLFKALNDKWVAGTNYNEETLFEDILLLDRANRNIGDKVIVDIFDVINFLKGNPTATVYNVVASLLQKNNFVIFNMPTYINFYGYQKVDEQQNPQSDFSLANSLFGTFEEVDYQDSRSKMVCQYAEQPSEQTENPNIKNGYNNDSFDFERTPQHPLVEGKQEDKEDYGLSNKAVGFNVDFGYQNQSVFTNVDVSQNVGKPTSESLRAEYEMANLYKGTNTHTQNVSLINIYKTRSYESTVTSMGNAMIQPTMYFVLRNMPLFGGPYLITEVEHTVSPTQFLTKMKGTRQRVYTPPISNPLLQTIKNTFVARLKNNYKTKKQAERVATNTIQVKNKIATNINSTETPSPNQICKVLSNYFSFTSTTAVQKSTAVREVLNTVRDTIRSLNGGSDSGDTANYVVITLFYIESYDGTSFKYYNNNPSQIPIGSGTTYWGDGLTELLKPEYSCLNDANNFSQAYGSFETLEKAIEFNYAKYPSIFGADLDNVDNENVFVTGFTKTWIERYPQDNRVNTENIYNNFVQSYPDELLKLQDKVRKSYNLVKGLLSTP
jgi:hypothetical protein